MHKIYTLLILLCCATAMLAQPATTEQYGCHFVKSKAAAKRGPMTAEKLATIAASNNRSDTFDIIHYDLKIDISSYSTRILRGECTVMFAPKIADVGTITLDLLGLTVDSVKNTAGENLTFSHQGLSLVVTLPNPGTIGEMNAVTVWYHGIPIQSPSNFGGVYFESNYIYNLSIGLTDDPHNFGHAWFPCFDNFVERSSFEMSFLTTLPYRTYATGDFLGEIPEGTDKVWRTYRLDVPSCTYHVSFAAADYGHIVVPHQGILGQEYPIELLAKHSDTTWTKNACINYLHAALDCYEYWFGPYPYNKVGYAMTTRGAMENPGNTIYPVFLVDPNNNDQNINILTHELAHQWWGNVVTVGSEQDMWVKEGNAEYGAHLFVEYFFDEATFIGVEKSNNYDMLLHANYDDGAFLPLSPMPHEITYGTTTYNKGAMTMHNLRYYLGDSLYRAGMTHLQTALRYEAMDAAEMRDSLTAFTGVPLYDFFEDWIFNPGWADYAIDSCVVSPLGNGNFEARVHVRQGSRASLHPHHNTPLEVDFLKPDGSFEEQKMMVAGEKGEAVFVLPYEPQFCALNRKQRLNLGQVAYEKVIKAASSVVAVNTLLSLTIKNVPAGDSALVSVVHHWSAPDVTPELPSSVKISGRHYWELNGKWPAGFVTNGIFRYDRSVQNGELDADLLQNTPEDSLLLLYRPGAGHEWIRFPRVNIFTVGSANDGSGILRVDTLLAGEYALATGYMDFPVPVKTPKAVVSALSISPNPSAGLVQITVTGVNSSDAQLALYSINGELLRTAQLPIISGSGNLGWDVGNLPTGAYILQLHDADGQILAAEQLIRK